MEMTKSEYKRQAATGKAPVDKCHHGVPESHRCHNCEKESR